MPVEERDRRLRQRFDELDTNHDGKLDVEEAASHVNHLRGN
jgi:Ca2+-binding EF-hand superfamily protein